MSGACTVKVQYPWVAWHATIDYKDIIVCDALAHVFEDEICLNIMDDSKQDLTFEEALK